MFDLKKRLDDLNSGAVKDQRQFVQDMLIQRLAVRKGSAGAHEAVCICP
ncbi:hypothetical protein [Edaphobacter aggregans]|nr:hypothetical protein [Edaphobacter aggregans]